MGQGFLLPVDGEEQGEPRAEGHLCGSKGNQCFSVRGCYRIPDSSVKFQEGGLASMSQAPTLKKGTTRTLQYGSERHENAPGGPGGLGHVSCTLCLCVFCCPVRPPIRPPTQAGGRMTSDSRASAEQRRGHGHQAWRTLQVISQNRATSGPCCHQASLRSCPLLTFRCPPDSVMLGPVSTRSSSLQDPSQP